MQTFDDLGSARAEPARLDAVQDGLFCPAGDVGEHNSALPLFTEAFRNLSVPGDPVALHSVPAPSATGDIPLPR